MADSRQRTTIGNRFRFLMRFLGLTGLVATVVGLVLLSTVPVDVPTLADTTGKPILERVTAAGQWVGKTAEWLWKQTTSHPDLFTKIASGTLLGGIAGLLLWALTELLGAMFLVTGRRTAVGLNSYLQIGLAIALLVIVNAYSFYHFQRFDCTQDQQFTLPDEVITRLQAFTPNSPVDVVVLQLHKTAGAMSDKPDALDFAAERKVVEKVRDLVDQLRDLGPRFKVTVLDVEEENYQDRLETLTQDAPTLRAAIENAPENSIFFHADRRVQRMSFSEFYLLDKTASQKEIDGRKRVQNLVLIPQGVETFARKIESLGEKQPRVGLAVIHPVLTTQDDFDEYTAQGLRRSLEANGFAVQDIILKRWGRGAPTPASYTFEEYELDRIEGRYFLLSQVSQLLNRQITQLTEVTSKARAAQNMAEAAAVLQPLVRGKIETQAQVDDVLLQITLGLEDLRFEADEVKEALAKVAPQYQELLKNETAYEARRGSDVKTKFASAVAECDILIIPRMTVMDIARRGVIESWLYNLSADQADVVREFIAAGKPVLAMFGPIKVGQGGPGAEPEPDPVEELFARLGVEFGNQTLVYDVEAQAAAERQDEVLGGGGSVDIPGLVFDLTPPEGKAPNPIAQAFSTAARSVDANLKVKKSGFRPIYLNPRVASAQPFHTVIAESTKDAWNEERPVGEGYVPKFDPAKLDDPKKGTRDEERRGPFPVAQAMEVPIPAEWLDKSAKDEQEKLASASELLAGAAVGELVRTPTIFPMAGKDDTRVRIVTVGNGGLFVGKKLEPAYERLLLDTLNWQLKREDRLPRQTGTVWSYPRTELTQQQYTLWRWGGFLGLPLLCAYFGLIMLMFRRVR